MGKEISDSGGRIERSAFRTGGPREHSEHESEKSQVDESARVERYSEADPRYLPMGDGQPAGQDIKTTERVG
jgi:hypothetical protein